MAGQYGYGPPPPAQLPTQTVTAKKPGFDFSSLLGPIGGIIGGIFGDKGQRSANQANLQIARENRQWQERMSNSAYQRSAKDLEAAGLNRILALGNSASTPSGNTAQMQNTNTGRAAAATQAAHSAMSLRQQQQAIYQSMAQENLSDSQARNVDAQTKQAEAMLPKIAADAARAGAATALDNARLSKADAEAAIYDSIGPALIALKETLPWASTAIDAFIKALNYRKGNKPRTTTTTRQYDDNSGKSNYTRTETTR